MLRVCDFGLRTHTSGFRIRGLGFRVSREEMKQGLLNLKLPLSLAQVHWVYVLGFRLSVARFRVEDTWFRIRGWGFMFSREEMKQGLINLKLPLSLAQVRVRGKDFVFKGYGFGFRD